MVGMTPIKDKATLKIIRQGDEKTINFNIGLLPEQVDKLAGSKTEKAKSTNRLGLSVTDLTAEERQLTQVSKGGVLVQNIAKGAAKSAGVQLGDVILRIDNQLVHDVAGFEKIVKSLPVGKSVAALIQRRGNPAFLALKIDK